MARAPPGDVRAESIAEKAACAHGRSQDDDDDDENNLAARALTDKSLAILRARVGTGEPMACSARFRQGRPIPRRARHMQERIYVRAMLGVRALKATRRYVDWQAAKRGQKDYRSLPSVHYGDD